MSVKAEAGNSTGTNRERLPTATNRFADASEWDAVASTRNRFAGVSGWDTGISFVRVVVSPSQSASGTSASEQVDSVDK